MQSHKTHFEQIPLETVKKIVEDQSRQGESAEQMVPLQETHKPDFKPKLHNA